MLVYRNITFTLVAVLLGAGCVSTPPAPEPYSVPNAVRNEIGRLAVRGPTDPKVSLTEQVDNRSEAAGNTASSAGAGWLDASLEAAGSSDNAFGGLLIAAFGLVTTPMVAAGGAVYGAASADSDESIDEGNRFLAGAFGFVPDRFQQSLESEFKDTVPLTATFVGSAVSNQQLATQGFDSVLDMQMNSIATLPSASQFEVNLNLRNTLTLTRLTDGREMARREYNGRTDSHKLSYWADNDGEALTLALAAKFADLSAEVANEFFLRPSIGVAGLEPVTRSIGYGKINATVPMFVWRSWDGDQAVSSDASYELQIVVKGELPGASLFAVDTRYVPVEPLLACTKYHWRVRALYQRFGQPAVSDWSPDYRFRTSCRR